MRKRLISSIAGFIVLFLTVPAAAQDVAVMPAVQESPAEHWLALMPGRDVPARVHEMQGPKRLKVGEEGLFTATGNLATASLPVQGRWDFGDGTRRKGMSARHIFREPGRYTVIFLLSNGAGADTDSLQVKVVPQSAPAGSR